MAFLSIMRKLRKTGSASKVVGWFIVAAFLALAGYYLARPLTTEYIAHAQVSVTPFTLQQDFVSFDAQHPAGRLALKMTVARRADGAKARINRNFDLNGYPEGTARVVDLPDGRELMAYDDVHLVVRAPAPPAWVVAMHKQAILNPPSNCVSPGHTLAGYTQVQGYRVAVVKWPQLAGATRYTAWAAPQLACQTLESLSEAPQADGTFAPVGKTKVVSLTIGEPDASLFDVPSSYRSVMPSEALRKEVAHLGKTWTEKFARIAKTEDENYLRHANGDWGKPPKSHIFQESGPAGPESQ